MYNGDGFTERYMSIDGDSLMRREREIIIDLVLERCIASGD